MFLNNFITKNTICVIHKNAVNYRFDLLRLCREPGTGSLKYYDFRDIEELELSRGRHIYLTEPFLPQEGLGFWNLLRFSEDKQLHSLIRMYIH